MSAIEMFRQPSGFRSLMPDRVVTMRALLHSRHGRRKAVFTRRAATSLKMAAFLQEFSSTPTREVTFGCSNARGQDVHPHQFCNFLE